MDCISFLSILFPLTLLLTLQSQIPTMSLLESQTDRIIRDHVLKRWAENLGPVAGWRTLPEIPTGAEINPPNNSLDVLDDASDLGVQVAEGNRLPINTIDGPWSTKDAYIEAHYKLLREDSVAPLREAVRAVKANPGMTDKGDVCIYTHVSLLEPQWDGRIIILTLQGPCDWVHSDNPGPCGANPVFV